jgi:hypothetical protein
MRATNIATRAKAVQGWDPGQESGQGAPPKQAKLDRSRKSSRIGNEKDGRCLLARPVLIGHECWI